MACLAICLTGYPGARPPAAGAQLLPLAADRDAPRLTAGVASGALWRDVLLADREAAVGSLVLPARALGPVALQAQAEAAAALRPARESRAGRLAAAGLFVRYTTAELGVPPARPEWAVRAGARALLRWGMPAGGDPATGGAAAAPAFGDAEAVAGASLLLPDVRRGVRAYVVDAELARSVARGALSSAVLSAALPFEANRNVAQGCCQIAGAPHVFVSAGNVSTEALRGGTRRPPFRFIGAGVGLPVEFRLSRPPAGRLRTVLLDVRASRRSAAAGRSGVTLALGYAVGPRPNASGAPPVVRHGR